MSDIDGTTKKRYEKPAVTPVSLAVKEVLGGCKTENSTGPGTPGLVGGPIGCISYNCSGDNKPS